MMRDLRAALVITCIGSLIIGFLVGRATAERENRFMCAGDGFVEASPECR